MRTVMTEHWHHLPASEVLELLDTDPQKGLDTLEVQERQERYGANRITPKKGDSALKIFLNQLNQPMVLILLVAAVGTAFLKEFTDMGVILAVVLVNAVIGLVQESKALKAIEALSKSMESSSTVLRAGEKSLVNSSELVPGDVVVFQSGDRVPADCRLLAVRELQTDESALTGESVPVEKQTESLDPEIMLAERTNMVYSSTLVTYGTGTGVVTAPADDTEIGRINELIASADILSTPLSRKIEKLSHILIWAVLGLAAVTFIAGWIRDFTIKEIFLAAVALAVGSIPEGLPAVITITLAIGVARMAERHAIIRKLPAVETLGSTTVICSDKTGTLTQNQMTVQEIWAGRQNTGISGVGYAPEGMLESGNHPADLGQNHALAECLKSGLLCNDSRLVSTETGWRLEGDPTEGALWTSAMKAGFSPEKLFKEWPRQDAIPFESHYQYMATMHRNANQPSPVVYVKGSVESLVSRCRDEMSDRGDTVELGVEAIHRQVEGMTDKGLRVLAFARKEMPGDIASLNHEDVSGGLTFIGLQGMMDPPRPEAIKAVSACQSAGIRVKMITGDHVGTAKAVARELGILGNSAPSADGVALSGSQLETISDRELIDCAAETAVFARVAPVQKLRLVEALQARKQVVAMTGDGVNDAPALRQADIGIAMGITGTEVAKETADMVLTDDNFATIEAAIEEGRSVYDNLMKFITWTLPTNLGEGLVILIAVFAGLTLPILPLQILWINMATAVFLGATLAFEAGEPGIMQRPPRPPGTQMLSRPLAWRILWVGCLITVGCYAAFELALLRGMSDQVARTAAVNLIVFCEIFYLFSCRSLKHSILKLGLFSNLWLFAGVLTMVLLQLAFTYAPLMNRIFQSRPIDAEEWMVILASGIVVYLLAEADKWRFRRKEGDRVL